MVEGPGETGRALQAARRALADGDEVLARADRVLAETLAGARSAAQRSVQRIDVVRAGVDAIGERGPADSAVETRHVAAAIAAGHREVIAAVTDAGTVSAAKAVVLQNLCERYRSLTPAGRQ